MYFALFVAYFVYFSVCLISYIIRFVIEWPTVASAKLGQKRAHSTHVHAVMEPHSEEGAKNEARQKPEAS